MLPQLRLSFQMVMRSPFVLWEELFDTSSRISENHWLFHEPNAFAKCAAAELLQSMGDWGSPNKQHLAKWIARGIACDVWLIKNANSFFKRTLSRFSQIQTSQAVHLYTQIPKLVGGHAPTPANCDGTSQAVHYGTQTFSSSKNNFYRFS